jgi:hypothetical protein
MDRGHPFPLRVEWHFGPTRKLALELCLPDSSLCGGGHQRRFRGITDGDPRLRGVRLIAFDRRIVAERATSEEQYDTEVRVVAVVHTLTRFSSGPRLRAQPQLCSIRQFHPPLSNIEDRRTHEVLGERAGLIGADDRHRTKGLDGRQLSDQGMPS